MRTLLVVVLAACAAESTSESMTCGAGTTLEGTECVAPPTGCGTGTSDSSGTCLVNPVPDVVVRAPTRIAADPLRIVTALVAGDAAVSARIAPATAGTVSAPVDGTIEITPCDRQQAGCLGPATIEVLSAAGTVVGTAPVELVAGPVLETGELCRGMQIADISGLVVQGRGYLAPDDMTLRDVDFEATGATRHLEIRLMKNGVPWEFILDTVQAQRDIAPGHFTTTGENRDAWFNIRTQGPYATCDSGSDDGELEIIAYDPTQTPARVTLAFRHACITRTGFYEARGCLNIE